MLGALPHRLRDITFGRLGASPLCAAYRRIAACLRGPASFSAFPACYCVVSSRQERQMTTFLLPPPFIALASSPLVQNGTKLFGFNLNSFLVLV